MDETTQMVLGAIEKMNSKLDEVKDILVRVRGRHALAACDAEPVEANERAAAHP
jgi:hypothetical protein